MSKTKYLLGALFAAVLSFSIFSHGTYAAEKFKIHIGISPVQDKMELQPGESYSGTFKVQNLGTDSFTFKLSVSPFQVKNQEYDQDLVTQNSYTKISSWVTFPVDSATLKPGDTKEMNYTINVPTDVPAGGQYAVISASTSDGSDGSIRSSKSVGMKIIARVAGTTRESGEIVNNLIDTFFTKAPIRATSLVSSDSNVDITAKYSMNVYSFITNRLAYSSENDENFIKERTILPETKYFRESKWDGSPALGIFKVRQTVELLGKVSTNEKVVIICPLWLLLIIVVIVILMIFFIINSIKQRKTNRQSARY